MNVPEGYTEDQVLQIIEKIINYFARVFKFGYYELDDMKQEGRLFALEAIPKFNPNMNCTLETFLVNSLKSRFINLYRDKCYRTEPPCAQCSHLKENECIKYTDKLDCKKWTNWLKRNKSKRVLSHASSNDDVLSDIKHEDNLLETVAKRELIHIIDKRLPSSYRSDYKRLLANVHIPVNRRKKLLNILKHILGDYLYGEDD